MSHDHVFANRLDTSTAWPQELSHTTKTGGFRERRGSDHAGKQAIDVLVRAGSDQTVGTVPPSMTYSVPVIAAARGEARKATRSATSSGRAGRPIGMPPSEAIN